MGITVATTRVACSTSASTQTITTSDLGGLTPKAAILILSGATSDATASDDVIFAIGITDGTTHRTCGIFADHGVGTSDTSKWAYTDRVMAVYTAVSTLDGYATFDSWTTNGIVIDWSSDAVSAGYLLTVILFAGTDLSVKVGESNPNDSDTGTLDETGVGFEADCVYFLSPGSGMSFSNSAQNQATMSIGIASNTAGDPQYALGHRFRDARASTQCQMYISDSDIFTTFGAGEAVSVGTWDSSGFTLTSNGAQNASTRIAWLALAFGGVASCLVGSHSTPTSSGSNSETGVGFEPQCVVATTTLMQAYDTLDGTALAGTTGHAVWTGNAQYSITGTDEDGVATTNSQSLSDDQALNIPDHDGTLEYAATFTSFDANGWTLNYTTAPGTATLMPYLAIETVAAGGDPEGHLVGGKLLSGSDLLVSGSLIG